MKERGIPFKKYAVFYHCPLFRGNVCFKECFSALSKSRNEIPLMLHFGAVPEESSYADVFARMVMVGLFDAFVQCLDNFGRASEYERAGRDDGVFSDESVGADDGAVADHRAVKHSGAHADETIVLDGAGMNGHAVTYGDIFTEMAAEIVRQMDAGIVLYIGALSYGDFIDVAAQSGVVPDIGIFADSHAADNICTVGDECRRVDGGRMFVESFDGHG